MALEIKLSQKLSQSLVMTPQLQQAIKLLQLGRLDYVDVLEKELLENPLLEDGREDTAGDGQDLSAQENSGVDHQSDDFEFNDDQLNAVEEETKIRLDDQSQWSEFSESYDDSYSNQGIRNSSAAVADDRPSVENNATRPEGLATHLLWQLRAADLNHSDMDIAAHIVGNIDNNGFLCATAEELSLAGNCSTEEIERVLEIVQSLDPAGVGARDLRECLMIQLEQQGLNNSLAYTLADKYLQKLELHRYDQIAKEESIAIEEVYDAVKIIRGLEPRPGRPFADEAPVYITPDIYVRKVDDEYVISLNEVGMPKLRLSNYYKNLCGGGNDVDSPNKQYLQDCMRSATWLIKSIHQRQQTIYKVTKSIMQYQGEFLEKGVAALKPLVLREIAQDVGMHESTISRVTANKYVHTPQGVFELKFFFTSGLKKGGEGEVSSESVKERIKALVSAENPKKPLSDQTIAEQLKSEGVDIARRTVAKYREMLNILPSSKRKKIF